MPKKSPPKLMIEKNSPRGLVPTSTYGALDEQYNAYLEQVGVRDENRMHIVHHALAASNDARFRNFLQVVQMPGLRRQSLATLAKRCDISLPQFAEFWQKAQHQRALAVAQNGITDHIVPDMIEDARSSVVTCDRCDGFGWVDAADNLPKNTPGLSTIKGGKEPRHIRTCPLCKGKGTVLKTGDSDSRKLLLEMTGLTNKKGSAVQITQHFGGMGIESAVDRMNKVTFEVGEVIDVEAEPVPEYSNSEGTPDVPS